MQNVIICRYIGTVCRVLVNAQKSFSDLTASAVLWDAGLMAGGYVLMAAYTVVMLGSLTR